MSSRRYGKPAVLLHWLHAVLVLGLLAVGWIMVDMPNGPDRSTLIGLHKSFGLCALALILARAWWRPRTRDGRNVLRPPVCAKQRHPSSSATGGPR